MRAGQKNVLQNNLDLSNQNAEMLVNFITKAQSNQVQPINRFTVQVPTVQAAAEDVAKRINGKNPTLPPCSTRYPIIRLSHLIPIKQLKIP
jgi:hypothetical protein